MIADVPQPNAMHKIRKLEHFILNKIEIAEIIGCNHSDLACTLL